MRLVSYDEKVRVRNEISLYDIQATITNDYLPYNNTFVLETDINSQENYGIQNTSEIDFDTIEQTGFYTSSTNIGGLPTGAYYLTHIKLNNTTSYAIQIAISHALWRTYIRTRNADGGWGAWVLNGNRIRTGTLVVANWVADGTEYYQDIVDSGAHYLLNSVGFQLLRGDYDIDSSNIIANAEFSDIYHVEAIDDTTIRFTSKSLPTVVLPVRYRIPG
jgi:hypothetical protein